VDARTAISVVPIIIGLVVLALKLGLPPAYEAPLAIAISVTISLGYTVAIFAVTGAALADALLHGIAVGLSSAGLVASIRRLVHERRAHRRSRSTALSRRARGSPRRHPRPLRPPRRQPRPPVILPGAPPDPWTR